MEVSSRVLFGALAVVLASLLGPATPAVGQIDLGLDLVVYLPFHGDYLDASTSGAANHASVGGGQPEFTAGLFGQAVSFEHLDDPYTPEYVRIADDTHNPSDPGGDLDFWLDTDFTVLLWMNQPEAQSGVPALISNKDSSARDDRGWGFSIRGDEWFVNQAGDMGLGQDMAGSAIPPNEWTMLAASFDRDGQITTYQGNLDPGGNEVFRQIDSVSMLPGDMLAFAVNIAQDGTGTSAFGENFAGSVDDVAIWRRALTAEEIHAVSYYGQLHGEDLQTLQDRTDYSGLPPLPELPDDAIIPIGVGKAGDLNDPVDGTFLEVFTNAGTVRYKVGVTPEATSGPGQLAVTGPALTVYDAELIDAGQTDAYDRALVVALNGQAVSAPRAAPFPFAMGELTTTTSGAVLLAGKSYTMDNGFDAQLSYYFSETDAIVRTMLSLTNNSGAPLLAEILFANALGSDDQTTIVATASGDTALDNYDRWIITDDSDGRGDPTITTVYHGPESSVALQGLAALRAGDNTFGLLEDVTVADGGNVNYLFFSEMAPGRSNAINGLPRYDSIDSLRMAGLLEGIPQSTSFANWEGGPADPPQRGLIPYGSGNNPAEFVEITTADGDVRYEVGVAVEVTHDAGIYDHDGPAMTVYEGELLGAGQSDAYDRALVVAINGENVTAAMADAASFDATLQEMASGAQLLTGATYTMDNGLDATLSYYFSDADALVRTIVELANNTASSIDAGTLFANALGSDATTTIIDTASGDSLLDPADRWVITDDVSGASSGPDPVLTHVYFGVGAAVGLAGLAQPDVLNPDDLSGLLETVTLDAGEETALMFFSSMSLDRDAALADVGQFESLEMLEAAGLMEGAPAGLTFANWQALRCPGDADQSGSVDLTDFNIWNANKFKSNTTAQQGDFDGNGATDLSDFNIWNANKFTTCDALSAGQTAHAEVQGIPEPGTVVMLAIFSVVLLGCHAPRLRGHV